MIAPTLTTDRLVLRQLRVDDADSLFGALSDGPLMQWWSAGAHHDVAETAAYLSFNAATDGAHRCWAITCDDDIALGWVILLGRRPKVAEIGYILRRDHWGRGIAAEAVSRVIDYGCSDLGLRRVYADSDPDNEASIGLLERLGFQREGRLRGQWETHIGVRDSLIFGLLRDEWRK